MTKFQLARIAAATAVAALCSSVAFASDTLSMTVQANVLGTCKLVTVPTLDFGDLYHRNRIAVILGAANVTDHRTKGVHLPVQRDASSSPFTGA